VNALLEALGIAGGGALLWLAGTVVFDAVHCLLHQMLASRSALLRALAWPHGVHHRWLDRELRANWEFQRRNVACHLVPEFLTQVAFSGALLLMLPPAPVWLCIGLQTLAFVYLLSQRGLDINHRSVELLDAYAPSFVCPPAYHALHHVFPDAYFSAYTKLVDVLVGSAAHLEGRRFALLGSRTPFGRAIAEALRAAGSRRPNDPRVCRLPPRASPRRGRDARRVRRASRALSSRRPPPVPARASSAPGRAAAWPGRAGRSALA
jgi:monoglucosyldiacylglycerol epimerase